MESIPLIEFKSSFDVRLDAMEHGSRLIAGLEMKSIGHGFPLQSNSPHQTIRSKLGRVSRAGNVPQPK